MSWLTEFVRPKIRTLFARREVPDNLWHQCPACQQMIFHRDLLANLQGLPALRPPHARGRGRAPRLDLRRRQLHAHRAAEGGRRSAAVPRHQALRRPAEGSAREDASRRRASWSRTARSAASRPSSRRWSSSSSAARWAPRSAKALLAAARLAVLQEAPLIVFTASGGARMQEGAISLMQMPRTVIATRLVKEAGLPFIVVLTDPTTGGVTASFAMLGDIQIAEPGALIGFAGARVIEQTVREKLPEGFQRAEYLHEHGIIDMVVKRTELKATLARVIRLAARQGTAGGSVMAGHGRLSSGRIDGIVARLHGLHPRLIDLSLDRLLDPAGEAGSSGAAPAAGDPCRRHQRQGQHLRLPARHGRGGRACACMSTPRRIWCASTNASASPAQLVSDEALATRWSRSSGSTPARRSPCSRSSPPPRSICSRRRRPICACWRSGLAAAATPPT